jgi:hypothetical protein
MAPNGALRRSSLALVPMKLREIEKHLGITFPARHKQAMADTADPVHEACDFLVPASQYEGLCCSRSMSFCMIQVH